jgi:hypothetical protein
MPVIRFWFWKYIVLRYNAKFKILAVERAPFFAGFWFFHVELCSQVDLRDRAPGGARGIYCALGRFAGNSAERPAECAMHHAGDNSSQCRDSFRCGPVFPGARQPSYFNKVCLTPASTALHLPLLVTSRLSTPRISLQHGFWKNLLVDC